MLVLPDDITLFDVRQQCSVSARLVPLTRELAATEIDGKWWKIEASQPARDDEEDHHWVWRKLVGEHRNDLAWEALAVQSSADEVEGAILYRLDARSQLEVGKGAIFGDRLATAPRNRPWLVNSPRFRGVGSALLLAAVRHSYALGLGGRVALVSLPSERTREFYVKKGFRLISEDRHGNIMYELPTEAALSWLKREGNLG